MTSIPYHLDDERGAKLSLQWVNEDPEQVQGVEVDRRTSNDSPLIEYRSRIVEHDHLPTTIHCLYEAELYPQRFPDLDNQLDELDIRNEALLLTVIDAFNRVQDEWEEDGIEVKWYKEPELDVILETIDQVQFGQSVPVVGGELLSLFITNHPLPNANHRVAISLLETYLSMYDSGFEMPNTGVTGEWFDWAENFVYKSKRLMTLARKLGLLNKLQDCGCEQVVRDGDNVIRFEDHDFSVQNYFEYYAENLHRQESIGFVHGVLDRTDNAHLLNLEDDGQRAFLDRLSA